jgi:hypothetical protein
MGQHEADAEKSYPNHEKHRLRSGHNEKAIGESGNSEAEAQCIEPADVKDNSTDETNYDDGTDAKGSENKADSRIAVVKEKVGVHSEVGELSDNHNALDQNDKVDRQAPAVSQQFNDGTDERAVRISAGWGLSTCPEQKDSRYDGRPCVYATPTDKMGDETAQRHADSLPEKANAQEGADRLLTAFDWDGVSDKGKRDRHD